MKSIRIDTVKFVPGNTMDWVLMRKNLKNHKVDFVDSAFQASINFTNKIQSISIEEYEHMIFSEVQELHNNKDLSEIDPLILDFCQFISLKSVGDHLKYAAPPFLGKRTPLTSNKTLKEDYVYFYQSIEGVNAFMHPLDLDYLMEYYGDVNELPAQLTTRINAVQKIVQRAHHRKFWPQFSHVNLNFDYDIVQVALEDLIEDFDPESYVIALEELGYELKVAEKSYSNPSIMKKKMKQSDYDEDDHYFGEGYDDADRLYQLDALEEIIIKRQGLQKAVNCKRGGNPGKGGKKKPQEADPAKDGLKFFEEKQFQEIINRINQGENITTANYYQYLAAPEIAETPNNQQSSDAIEPEMNLLDRRSNSQNQTVDSLPISNDETLHQQINGVTSQSDERGRENDDVAVPIKKSKKKTKQKYRSKLAN